MDRISDPGTEMDSCLYVNGYNQRQEKELLLGSQVDSSLDNSLKSCAKIIVSLAQGLRLKLLRMYWQ